MATSFSANQYQNAFEAKKLQNWEVPAVYKQRPDSQEGFTQIIANDGGHLLQGKSKKNPWGDFVGTWDLPEGIPGNRTKVPTARTTYAQQKLQYETDASQQVLSGKEKNRTRTGVKDNKTQVQDTAPSRRSGARAPTTQDRIDLDKSVSSQVPCKPASPAVAPMISPAPPEKPDPEPEADPQEPIMAASPIVPSGSRCSQLASPQKSPQPPIAEIENS